MVAAAKNRLQSLRKFVWSSDKLPSAKDVGEALNDLWQALSLLFSVSFVNLSSQVYATPFYVTCSSQPSAVFITRCMVSKSFETVIGATPVWTWTGTQLRIDAIYASRAGGLYPSPLTSGGSYDITFLMVA